MAAADVIKYLGLLDVNNRPLDLKTWGRTAPKAAENYKRRLDALRKELEDQGYNLSGIDKSFAAAGKNASKVAKLSIDLAKDIRMGNMGRANTLYNEIQKLGGMPDSVVGQFTLPAERRDVIKFGNPKSAVEEMDSRISKSFIEGTPETAKQTNERRAKEAVVKAPAKETPTPAPSEPAPTKEAPAEEPAAEPSDMMGLLRGEKITLDEPAAKPAPATDMADLYKGKPIVAVADSGPAFSSPKEPVIEPAKVDMDRALALFQNTHGGPFDPKSSKDKDKMAAIESLMAQKGSEKLTPNQFSLQIYRQSK